MDFGIKFMPHLELHYCTKLKYFFSSRQFCMSSHCYMPSTLCSVFNLTLASNNKKKVKICR